MSETPPENQNDKRTDIVWLAGCVLISAAGFFLRFVWLGLKPFHHDEGVNGWFLTNLYRDGTYKYDPANYHGPTLYYITLGFVEVFGLDTVPVRWSVAIWGVLIVVLAFYLRRYIGNVGALAAALFLAISPGMVFISRYFIHEIFFVFLGLAFVIAVLLFIERQKAGAGAIAWTSLILFVCFIPSGLNFSALIAGDNTTTLWVLRGLFFAIEAALIFFVMRMLASWNGGRPIYLLLAAACIALMLATKETTFITLGTMAISCVCVWAREQIARAASENRVPSAILGAAVTAAAAFAVVLAYKLPEVAEDFGKRTHELTGGPTAESLSNLFYAVLIVVPVLVIYVLYRWDSSNKESAGTSKFYQPSFSSFRDALGTSSDKLLIASAAAALIVYLVILFFSSFFTYSGGINGFFEAYAIWLKTGSKDHTQNGVWAYIEWGMKSDGPIMVLSLVGFLIALVKGKDRFAMFAGLWAFGLFLAYTIIPYKTPWLALSFLLPMCIAAGYAINEFIESTKPAVKGSGVILAAGATLILAYQTYDLNFVRYDDEDAPMVYAHTQREFLDMINDIEHFAEASGKGTDASIDIVSPDYWPMVWYMRDYPKAIFHGRITDSNAEMIVAKKGEQDNEVIRKYSGKYKFYKAYKLRSGVDLMLLVRKDIAGSKGQELYTIR